MFKWIQYIVAMSVIALSSTGYSQDTGSASQLVENRYFITFKDDAGLIDPPNPANKVAMGEHSSGQSKEELARTLGINGEILSIFDALNAILVEMDAQEAESWRNDDRVANVEQDRTVSALTKQAVVNPAYENGVLNIPSVDTSNLPGQFQDGELVFDPDIDAWRLDRFREVTVIDGRIRAVELVKTETRPVQVFLKISSPDIACNKPGKIGVRLQDNRFEIAAGFTPPPPNTLCAAVIVPFAETVSLPVFGLSAGTYEYSVNGEFEGSFDLDEDNTL